MARIEIPTLEKYQRPIIRLYKQRALIDTGAVIPMLSFEPEELQERFAVKLILDNQFIGGIGGQSMGSVYRLEEFKVGDIVYAPFDAFVPRDPILKYPILLSAPMFNGMFYGFDTTENKFIIETKNAPLKRTFYLRELNGQLYPQIDDVLVQDSNLLLNNMPLGLWL